MIEIDVNRLSRIERINVIGTSGSGKSTVGRQMAEALALPFFEMDAVYWKPHWQELTMEEFIPQIKSITDQPRWVLDGNYSRTRSVKWRQVQLVVWLDLPFAKTLFRVSSRCVKRSITQVEIWPGTGNRETLRKAFMSRQSVILWAMTNYRRNRRRYSELMTSKEYASVWFMRLKSQGDINSLLESARMVAKQR